MSRPFLGRKQSLKGVVENIMLIKEKVKEKLRLLGTPGSWNHITRQSGTHGYLGLNCKFQDSETTHSRPQICVLTLSYMD